MSFPLLANPNRHYYTTRRGRILGIVLHITAGLEDFTPPDLGADSIYPRGEGDHRHFPGAGRFVSVSRTGA